MQAPKIEPLRFGALKMMGKSPAHYRHYLDNPPKQTKAMLLGDTLDTLTFGGKEINVFEGSSRRGKAWDTFIKETPDGIRLLLSEYETACEMQESLRNNLQAMELLMCGQSQSTQYWKLGARECRGTPDVFSETKIIDLKTTRNANPYKFQIDGRFMGYHAQLAWYFDGLRSLGLIDSDAECYIVAVESSPPYPVVTFKLSQRAMIEGTKLWNLWFSRLMVCEETNVWPGYSDAIVPFETPDTENITLKIEGEELEVE